MKPRHLEAFRAIMDTGTVSQAARSLGVSQPAVSRMLTALEQDIGFELFHRIGGRLVPTRSALALRADVLRTLDSMENLRKISQTLRHGRYGEVKLGCAPSLVHRVVPGALERFARDWPDTRVIVEPRPSRIVVDMLSTRALELGLLFLPVEHTGLEVTPLRWFPTVCVLHESHPLATRKAISPPDLAGERLILLAHGDPARFAIDLAFRKARVAQRIAAETPNVALAANLAGRSFGVAIVNALMARDVAPRGVAITRFTPGIRHQMALLRPANYEISAESAALAECLRAELETVPGE